MLIERHQITTPINDGENNRVVFDTVYQATGTSLIELINEIKLRHGSDVYLLPLSGASCGGGILQVERRGDGDVVGILLPPPAKPKIYSEGAIDIKALALDEIVIDHNSRHIYAGSAITLKQLNQALTETVSEKLKVLGADLTSYAYAQVGATFMTGGMGPQRRYFSDSVNQIALFDGNNVVIIEGKTLKSYAGTYGWSGLVTAVRCDYFELPEHEIVFAIPISNEPETLARVLQHLSRYTYLDNLEGKLVSQSHGSNLILGIEHITITSMQPMLAFGMQNEITRRGKQLLQKCRAAKTDGLLFITGRSSLPTDEFLLELLDEDNTNDEFTIAGVNLEHTEIFQDPEQMRALREAIPFAARTQEPDGKHIYKNHTDVNLRLDPNNVERTMIALWQANLDYVSAIKNHIDQTPELNGNIIIYGHLNPVGVDPHNRLTLACDDKTIYNNAIAVAQKQQDIFIQRLKLICDDYDAIFVGGEKSAGTEYKMFRAFGGIAQAPKALKQKFDLQSVVIRTAKPMFNWRAMAPYR